MTRAAAEPRVRVLVWRGLLTEEIPAAVERGGLGDKPGWMSAPGSSAPRESGGDAGLLEERQRLSYQVLGWNPD